MSLGLFKASLGLPFVFQRYTVGFGGNVLMSLQGAEFGPLQPDPYKRYDTASENTETVHLPSSQGSIVRSLFAHALAMKRENIVLNSLIVYFL